MEVCCLFVQIAFLPNKSSQGLSIILNRCAERHIFVEHVESIDLGLTGGSVVAGTKEICTSEARYS